MTDAAVREAAVSPLASASGRLEASGWSGWWRRAVACVVISTLLSACYTYRPVVSAQPDPGMRVDLRLTDEGRIAVRDRIGPDIARVEGTIVNQSDTSFLLRVSNVHGLYGAQSKWNGEEVGIRREYVAGVRERRLDPVRSVLVGGSLVAALVIIFTTDLVGFGGDSGPGREPPGNGEV